MDKFLPLTITGNVVEIDGVCYFFVEEEQGVIDTFSVDAQFEDCEDCIVITEGPSGTPPPGHEPGESGFPGPAPPYEPPPFIPPFEPEESSDAGPIPLFCDSFDDSSIDSYWITSTNCVETSVLTMSFNSAIGNAFLIGTTSGALEDVTVEYGWAEHNVDEDPTGSVEFQFNQPGAGEDYAIRFERVSIGGRMSVVFKVGGSSVFSFNLATGLPRPSTPGGAWPFNGTVRFIKDNTAQEVRMYYNNVLYWTEADTIGSSPVATSVTGNKTDTDTRFIELNHYCLYDVIVLPPGSSS